MTGVQVNFHLFASDLARAVSFYTRNFNFELMEQIPGEHPNNWAALRTPNAILWLGKSGATKGLILLIEKELSACLARLKNDGVTCFIPEELAAASSHRDDILITEWGKHAWFLDSEGNVVMLFEPAGG